MSLAANLRRMRHRNTLRLALRDAVEHGDTEAAVSLRAELAEEERRDAEFMRKCFLKGMKR